MHDIEEGFVQSGGDRAHPAIFADEDTVHRTQMRDLGGGTGKEGFVTNVEELARQWTAPR